MNEEPIITGSIDDIRHKIVSLTFCCPHDHCNPPNCPLHNVRKLPYSERMGWCHKLGETDLLYLEKYHNVCLATKTKMEKVTDWY